MRNTSLKSTPANATPAPAGQPTAGNVDRRTFLAQATALTGGLMVSSAMGAPIVAGIRAVQPKAVMEIASFLTGKSDLSDDLVSRAHSALLAEYPDFDQRLDSLIKKIHTTGLSDVEAFKNSSLAADPELKATALAVVSALYTGRVGMGYKGHFVAYKDALMYRPTADVMVIPTYSHFAPGYWEENPK